MNNMNRSYEFNNMQNLESSFVDRPSAGPSTRYGTNVFEIQKQREFDKKKERLEEEFKKVDINTDGLISEAELLRFLDNNVIQFNNP